MILTIETLRSRAVTFVNDYENAAYEMGEGQNFIHGLCDIFNLDYKRSVRFEDRVKKLNGKGRIDAFFPSLLLVEMKSVGKDLDKAYIQATEYLPGLKDEELPRCILVSDFQNLHLYNQEEHGDPLKIKLAELPQYIESFRFLTGYEKLANERQERINKDAAEKMAGLHDAIQATGYESKDLETYLVRLLFCLFADDTGIFGENSLFLDYLKNYTSKDGADLHEKLQTLFKVLNKSNDKRLKNLPQHLAAFAYINGSLFDGELDDCYFDASARDTLIECCELDWGEISPAIFGSLFQAIMHFDDEQGKAKTKKRRELGAHYTSEANILKTINPLFMDNLRAEFEDINPKGSRVGKIKSAKLASFHQQLSALQFFDPACGCGNFLIIAYRELRLLELGVIQAQFGKSASKQLDIELLIQCNVDQFHGIDIDGSAVKIATVAMWLTDHQMNLKVQELGNYYHRIPLVTKANIIQGNALQIDWEAVIAPEQCSFIMGNPPFIGKKEQNLEQKTDLKLLTSPIKKGAGILDYVVGWHIKATHFMAKNPKISAAFVSTNSICQGEQVSVLWSYLLEQGVKIRFAYRTFKWSNEGKGVAAVHCVIVGFGLHEPKQRFIFQGEEISKVDNINPYLVDAGNITVAKRSSSLCKVSKINKGSEATDFGYLCLSKQEKIDLLKVEPLAEKWIKHFIGGEELINNTERYCLWLIDISPSELKLLPEIIKRVEQVREIRLSRKKKRTQEWAKFPTLFSENRQPNSDYLAIPKVSSENRFYLPIGFISKEWIASGSLLIISDASLFDFGILQSIMHNAWMRTVCGRMKSDYQYSAGIVYNNFPWADPTEKQIKAIETKAQAVLDAREVHKTSTLADLYNPLTMPPNLVKAHNALDKAVDSAYGYKGKKDDAERLAFLFERYQKLIDAEDKEATDQ